MTDIEALLNIVLQAAQTIRINQVQATKDAKWPPIYQDHTDRAWRMFNDAHSKLFDLLVNDDTRPELELRLKGKPNAKKVGELEVTFKKHFGKGGQGGVFWNDTFGEYQLKPIVYDL